MSELSPKAKALLEAARREHGPRAEDRERVLMGLHETLGIGVALPLLTEASAASAGQSGISLSEPQPSALDAGRLSSPSHPPPPVLDPSMASATPQVVAPQAAAGAQLAGKGALSLGGKLVAWKTAATKLAVAGLVVGGSATAALLPRGAEEHDVSERQRRAPAVASGLDAREPPARPDGEPERTTDTAPHARSESLPSPHEVGTRSAAVAEELDAADAPAEPRSEARATVTGHETSARGVRSARRAQRRGERREREAAQPRVSQPTAEPTPLASSDLTPDGTPALPELALIRRALTSLRDRDATQALVLLDEHAARYPNGAFSTERRGLRVLALCNAGRTEEGARERARFLEVAGESPIAARVRGACSRAR